MKSNISFVCGSCGTEHVKWQGRCDGCGEWSTLREESAIPRAAALGSARVPVPLSEIEVSSRPRLLTGIGELDRVLGGGVVEGSATLLAGDPGMGKSTLLLMAAGALCERGSKVLLVAGEESPSQVRLRAERISVASPGIHVLGETELEPVLAQARSLSPDLVVVDSIQTVHRSVLGSAPGTVSQVKECAAELTAFAKSSGIPVILIGHVTKTGDIAGPRVLSHVVDTVVSFEGDRYHAYRVLRAVKNRFGAADEIGIFEMSAEGLREVTSPAGFLLSGRGSNGAGSVAVPVCEGTRVFVLEVQALAARAASPPGRRRVTGLDPNRLDLSLAVLEKKGQLQLGGEDIFVNAAGGVRVEEPGADLGASLAVASSFLDLPFPEDTVAFGEVGLRGEIRPVSRGRARLAEAAKLGFARALVPAGTDVPRGIEAFPLPTVPEALEWLGGA